MSTKDENKKYAASDKSDVAEAIHNMSYGDMIRMCESILTIQRKRAADTREELAAVLHEWANSQ